MRSRTGTYMQEVNKTTDTCQKTTNKMREEFGSLDIDTEHQRTLAIAAHSIKAATKLCPSKNTKQNNYC